MNRTLNFAKLWRHQELASYRFLPYLILVAFLAQSAFIQSVNAAMVTFPLFIEYSGGTPPAGAAPWLTAVFDDEDTPGTVKLKLSTPGLVGTEFVGEWNFNLNPAILPSDISFSAPTKTGTFTDPVINKATNAFSAGPDASYDIEFDFAQASAGRFGVGDMAEYLITGSGTGAGLVALDFFFLSDPGNGGVGGPYRTAAHVQSIGANDDSGWIAVNPRIRPDGNIPEPATWLLMALALGSLGLRRAG